MSHQGKQWLPMLFCCLPGLVLIAVWALGSAALAAALNGPLGISLITLALLACPLSMGLMMWRGRLRQNAGAQPTAQASLMACCPPTHTAADTPTKTSVERLTALQERRLILEREVVELQSS